MKARHWILVLTAGLMAFQGAAAPAMAARFRDVLGAAGVLYAVDRLTRDPHQGPVVVAPGEPQVVWYDEYGRPRYDYYYYYVPIYRPWYPYPDVYWGVSVYWPWYWRYPRRRWAYHSYPRYYRPYWYSTQRTRYYVHSTRNRLLWTHRPRHKVVAPSRPHRYAPPARVVHRRSTPSRTVRVSSPPRTHRREAPRTHRREAPRTHRRETPRRPKARPRSGGDERQAPPSVDPGRRQDRYSPPGGWGRGRREGRWGRGRH